MRAEPGVIVAFVLIAVFCLAGALLPGCKSNGVDDEASCQAAGGMEQRGVSPPDYLMCPPGKKRIGVPWQREDYHAICCVIDK